MTHTVHNPPVPGVIAVHEELKHGTKLDIHGHVAHGHHNNFTIELLSGPHIVLHINFRFHNEHDIVLNSYGRGIWGEEVRHTNPLRQGDHFHVHIHVHETHYDVEVNGHKVASFHHRYPTSSVQAVGFKGDVHVEKVEFHGFHFHKNWSHTYDYGHAGYIGYGTEAYVAPVFNTGHAYNAYW